MPNIEVIVKNKIATISDDQYIVCGNSDYLAVFRFDEEWQNELVKTAYFLYNEQTIPVVFKGNTCEIPVLKNTQFCKIGVEAGNVKTTTSAFVKCKKSVTDENGNIVEPPKEEVYNQIINLINDIAFENDNELGASLELTVDKDYVLTVYLINQNGETISSKSVDLPIESLVVSAVYNDNQKAIIFTLQNGETLLVPVGDLVKGFVKEEDFQTLEKKVETLNSDKQQKYDDNLITQSKEIVGAINEVKGLAEETRMIFGETEGTAYEGNKGKKNADDISKLNLKLDLIERNIFQSGLGSIVPLTETFISRQTANGQNILDPSPAVAQMIKGKTVAVDGVLKHANFNAIKSTGKNLFNINGNITLGKRVATSTGAVYTNASYNVSDYIIINGLANVAISGTETDSGQYYYSLYDNNKKYIKGGGFGDGGYIPIPSNAYYLRFDFLATATSVMVNIGTTPKSFEPYKFEEYTDGNTYELAEYDYINPQTSELVTQTRTIVFDGTETWNLQSINAYGIANFVTHVLGVAESVICNYYELQKTTIASTTGNGVFYNGSGLYIRESSYSTVEDWKAHLAELYANGTPLCIAYQVEDGEIEHLDYPKEYTAYNGGSETVEQGDTDNSQWGAICEITTDYWLVKEI